MIKRSREGGGEGYQTSGIGAAESHENAIRVFAENLLGLNAVDEAEEALTQYIFGEIFHEGIPRPKQARENLPSK